VHNLIAYGGDGVVRTSCLRRVYRRNLPSLRGEADRFTPRRLDGEGGRSVSTPRRV